MVKVATTLDVPIKLVWPRVGTMLGLGDVVIPGLFVAVGVREERRNLHGLVGGYVVGLVGAMVAVNVTGRAQPALLYVRYGRIYDLCERESEIEQSSMSAVVRSIW
jgi:minor histocompatibility antigen H13